MPMTSGPSAHPRRRALRRSEIRYERWLFGADPWHPSIALRALNPVSFVRWYRSMRARRVWDNLGNSYLAWPDRGRLLRYLAWCRWQDLTGWKTRMNKGKTP